jgi:hypothetical protein
LAFERSLVRADEISEAGYKRQALTLVALNLLLVEAEDKFINAYSAANDAKDILASSQFRKGVIPGLFRDFFHYVGQVAQANIPGHGVRTMHVCVCIALFF